MGNYMFPKSFVICDKEFYNWTSLVSENHLIFIKARLGTSEFPICRNLDGKNLLKGLYLKKESFWETYSFPFQ